MKKITCLIDNSVKQSSRFWGEHGLSFCLEVDGDCVLFDTGRSEVVLSHNLGLMGKCLRDAVALVLSHAHLDHTGGLPGVLKKKPELPLYASPDLFRPRFTLREDTYKSIGLPLTQEELTKFADLHLSADPVEVLPGLWTTGEIVKRPEPEGRSPRHFVPNGDGWLPDPYQDDMSMVMETSEGLVVICGCCHAGLLNTLAHVQRTFQQPICTVVGGTHLVSADEAYLQYVIDVLRETYGSLRFYLNHCTGTQAYLALANAFGDRVNLYPAGTTLEFEQALTINVLIAADGPTLDSSVAKRFGHAPYYLYVDADTRQVQAIENTDHNDETHAIIAQMAQQGAEVFITGNIGPHAFDLVKSLNRQVAVARKISAKAALEKVQKGELEILETPTVKQSFHNHRHH